MTEINKIILPEKLKHIQINYPSIPLEEQESLVFGSRAKKYTDSTSNELTTAIVDYIRFTGGWATRVNTTGTYRAKEKIYTISGMAIGTPDIMGVSCSCFIGIEVKIGKDTLSDSQKKVSNQITSAGGKYFEAKDFIGFYNWFNKEINTAK